MEDDYKILVVVFSFLLVFLVVMAGADMYSKHVLLERDRLERGCKANERSDNSKH